MESFEKKCLETSALNEKYSCYRKWKHLILQTSHFIKTTHLIWENKQYGWMFSYSNVKTCLVTTGVKLNVIFEVGFIQLFN